MSFINPVNKKLKMLEEENQKLKENVKQETQLKDDEIIDINTILQDNKNNENNMEIEFIKVDTNAIMVSMPRSIELSSLELGNSVIKYENNINDGIIL